MLMRVGMNPAPRCAVVDLGSNSVRLVVYEGQERNPVAIFNEKAVLRLGKGLQATGRLNQQGVERALRVMGRYAEVVRAFGASPFEVLATAAVRDASNGAEFVAALQARMPQARIRILSGVEEARLSRDGLLCGIPGADGLLADIGGGSLELVDMDAAGVREAATLRLGVIRLAERAGGDLARARALADADLAAVPWIGQAEGRDLYLVGGAWRAMARVHMQATLYPLTIVHQYAISRAQAEALSGLVLDRKAPAGRRNRAEDLPWAATVLRRLLRRAGPRRVVFSAQGIREGWFMQQVPQAVREADPLLASAREIAHRYSRDLSLPPALIAWTAPLFPAESAAEARLREAACWMSDAGSHDHPDYRAEQAFNRVLRQQGSGMDHPTRAALALTLAHRYEAPAGAPFLTAAAALLEPEAMARAATLGSALRLAYTLSAGTPALLAETVLRRAPDRLVLALDGPGVFEGEGVARRLDHLAAALGVAAVVEAA